MGTKGYRNSAKSGLKAASAKHRQAVAKALTHKKPKRVKTPKKPKIEAAS